MPTWSILLSAQAITVVICAVMIYRWIIAEPDRYDELLEEISKKETKSN